MNFDQNRANLSIEHSKRHMPRVTAAESIALASPGPGHVYRIMCEVCGHRKGKGQNHKRCSRIKKKRYQAERERMKEVNS